MSARSDADPQLGRTLGGQYRIEALLGYGGMGRVYRGLQLSVKRAVAIKLIAGQAPYPAEWVQRFRREAEATASLSHPNSVRLFDFGVTDSEELYMVMELLEGIDLAHQLQASGALPLTAALSIARQVLLALCEAHALGITHRDIKPDNIFLANVRGADVVAKVMDFGIAGLAHAQMQSRLTGTGVIIGTPLYMSPEQAQGLAVDGKSDVYSLGVVLFEMLTGRPVFESNTAVNLLLAHVAKPPMRLQESGVKLREEASLQALLDRLLGKDPAQRPDAAEALDSITALAARLGIASATGSMRAVSLNAPAVREAPGSGSDASREARAGGAQRDAGRDAHTGDASREAPAGGALRDTGRDAHTGDASREARAGGALRDTGRDVHASGASARASSSSGHASSSHAPAAAHASRGPGLALSERDMAAHGFAATAARAGGEQDSSMREFQGVRVTSAPTGALVRPTIFVVGAGLVLTAATALALRWVPALVDRAQPSAAAPPAAATVAEAPEERAVLISSQPNGAHVFVDGADVGTTPFELKLRRDTEVSVAREGYRRKLVNVAYGTRSPVSIKLQAEDKPAAAAQRQSERLALNTARRPGALDPSAAADTKQAPLVFSFGQENAPSVSARRETTADKVRARTAPADKVAAKEHEPAPAPPAAPAQAQVIEQVVPEPQPPREPDDRPSRQAYAAEPGEHERIAELEAEHSQPSAAETTRSAATRNDPIQEDELSEVALDSDEQAQVKENYGLRAVGRAVARAFGRLLIPYPNRARRAELADMPLAYASFRDARNAYKHREIDATGFQEAVWQLRERRRQEVAREHDLYARGQTNQAQYEAHMDRIWDEFWGSRP